MSRADEEKKGQTWHLRERRFSAFRRAITLPGPVEVEKAQARHEHGVPALTIPRAEAAEPRQIRISGGSAQGQSNVRKS